MTSASGQHDPGPSQFRGFFLFSSQNGPAGPATLSITAQGYLPLAPPRVTPITVEVSPGPIQLPGGESFAMGLVAVAELAPA